MPVTFTAQKMKFSSKEFFSKCDQIHRKLQEALVTFTEEILNAKLHFLCGVFNKILKHNFKAIPHFIAIFDRKTEIHWYLSPEYSNQN